MRIYKMREFKMNHKAILMCLLGFITTYVIESQHHHIHYLCLNNVTYYEFSDAITPTYNIDGSLLKCSSLDSTIEIDKP